jgi:hypothetical protein
MFASRETLPHLPVTNGARATLSSCLTLRDIGGLQLPTRTKASFGKLTLGRVEFVVDLLWTYICAV